MSQDNSLNPSWDPDSTRPANLVDDEPTIKATPSFNQEQLVSNTHKLPKDTATAPGIDDDATLVVELSDDEFTQLVTQSGVPRPLAHMANTAQDATLQAAAVFSDSGSLSLSQSQTTYGSFASRGPSQLRKLAQ